MSSLKSYFKKTCAWVGFLGVLFFTPMTTLQAADFAQTFTFQGKLSDTGAAANGSYNIKFEICSTDDCSSVVWTEYHDAANAGQVSVTNGVFNAVLGSDETLVGVDLDQVLWLRISVDGTGASPSYATPLGIIPLGMVPAAREADFLDGLDSDRYLQVDATGSSAYLGSSGSGATPFYSQEGNSNTRLGQFAGVGQSGANNTLIGYGAGSTTSGWSNTLIGQFAGGSLTGGQNNVAVGALAGRQMAGGDANVAIGSSAGYTSTGSSNVFIGQRAAYQQAAGGGSVFIGALSGDQSTSASTTAIGFQSGYANTGAGNTFLGYQSGLSNTSAAANTFVGHQAGRLQVTGDSNSYFGSGAGASNATGTSNTFIGASSGGNVLGDSNIAIGANSLSSLVNGQNNISIGNASMSFSNNVSDSIVIGPGAGASMTGSGNILLGKTAGILSSAADSIFIGESAGQGASGSDKLYIENSSSVNPLIYGEFDNDIVRINGQLQSTGGIAVGVTSTDNLIDDSSNGASSATLYVGNETIDTSVSDRRLKQNIVTTQNSALAYLNRFNVVEFDWLVGNDRAKEGRVPFGLIAQDVAELAPQYSKQGENPEDYMSVRFQDMVPITIKAIQEIDIRVAALEARGLRGVVGSVSNAAEIVVERLRVRNELCIGDTCVDEEALKRLLSDNAEEGTTDPIVDLTTTETFSVKAEVLTSNEFEKEGGVEVLEGGDADLEVVLEEVETLGIANEDVALLGDAEEDLPVEGVGEERVSSEDEEKKAASGSVAEEEENEVVDTEEMVGVVENEEVVNNKAE